MKRHNIAKNILFCEIGSNVGVYDDFKKVNSDSSKGIKSSGTHLLESIEHAWSIIAINGDINLNVGWDAILTSSASINDTTTMISKSISQRFFGQASNQRLQMLIHDGVVNARKEIIRGVIFQ